MGLMLSVLIGCVGVLELLACLRHVTDGVVIRLKQPATPCLSYHEPANDNMSTHDSICSYSHSSEVNLPRGAKHKLENLHEYSLRIRAELRSLNKNADYSTMSMCSTRGYLLGSRASLDSRLTPDLDYLVRASESQEDRGDADADDDDDDDDDDDYYASRYERETSYEDAAENWRVESSSRDRPLSLTASEPERYVRIPTPIPFCLDDDLSSSGASSDVGTSFDNDSGNEAPAIRSLESIPPIARYKTPSEGGSSIDESDYNEQSKLAARRSRKSRSKSPKSARTQQETIDLAIERSKGDENLLRTQASNRSEELNVAEPQAPESVRGPGQRKKIIKSSSTIVRKPTRLKSKNAEVSKSAENLTGRKSKRHRDPERRKSDISVQTVTGVLRDEWTNTTPPDSPTALSRSESRRSVSVQVQTSFEDEPASVEALAELEGSVLGLSESRRDLTSRDRFGRRKSFKNRRFGSGSRDKADADDARDNFAVTNATASVERSKDEEVRLLKISSFEQADEDDYQRVCSILTDPEARESNGGGRKRRKGSRSASSFEDEEYWDAEDVSAGAGPIEYSIPDPDRNKAFWSNGNEERGERWCVEARKGGVVEKLHPAHCIENLDEEWEEEEEVVEEEEEEEEEEEVVEDGG
ncbi:unnamed protein product [Xylocopa violacea]|uniref:Uncharacterized protein n=1 Tax=Xylocopa violacea TaxID=135666 RepID=A0ABP1NS90_XYLVO